MKAQFVYEGKAIDYKPAVDVAAGEVVVLGDLVGVTLLDIAANQQGALQVTGVFDFVKASGDGGITLGASLYWDFVNCVVTTNSTDGGEPAISFPSLGKAIESAADTATSVRVRLDG